VSRSEGLGEVSEDDRSADFGGFGADPLLLLAIQNAVPQWTRTRNWTTALLAFKIHFGDRLPD
jgi:hypothetical protein